MKKIFLLCFFILFFSCGCYDYREINNLAIVSGIAIDYEDNNFNVVYEILNTKNQENSAEQEKVYYAHGNGKSISEAFYNTSLEIAKFPYLPHLKTVVISENVAKEHVEEIVDFLLRDNYIRNIFYLVVSKDTTAEEIIKKTDTNNPVVSTAIAELIESDAYVDNIGSDLNYEKFVTNIIDSYKDTYITSIKIENDVLKLDSIGLFKDYNLVDYLSNEESATFNILNGNSHEYTLKIPCPNDEKEFMILSTFNLPKSDIAIEENNVKLKTEIETRIVENHCHLDFKNIESYEKVQELASTQLKQKIKDVITAAINAHSDILKINQLYYQKNKTGIDFTTLNYDYDAKVIINRNGLIFEVENDK